MFLSVHVFSITCANIPQDRHQVPGRVDTRCRAAVRGQPIGRGGHRLSHWHLRPPACPQRCTTAERAPGHARPPATRQVPAPPGGHSPPGLAAWRLPCGPGTAVAGRHRPEAWLDSDGAPEGCPDATATALTAVHTIRMRGTFPRTVRARCGTGAPRWSGASPGRSCSWSMTTSRRPWKSDRSACADAGPRPSGTAAAGDAGGRQHAQYGQHDRAAEHGAEITEVVRGDTDADDRDGKA